MLHLDCEHCACRMQRNEIDGTAHAVHQHVIYQSSNGGAMCLNLWNLRAEIGNLFDGQLMTNSAQGTCLRSGH